mmetsp:Transcript_524/g.1446  ORF Transcript_524/g.1446 Transcript_524/m.1446 type:complete len:211 (-) Transcript_524:2664-3296(-)
MVLQEDFGVQSGADQREEVCGRVGLRVPRELVCARHHDEPLQQPLHHLHDHDRVQLGRHAHVDREELVRVLEQARETHGHGPVRGVRRPFELLAEDLGAQQLACVLQCLVLILQSGLHVAREATVLQHLWVEPRVVDPRPREVPRVHALELVVRHVQETELLVLERASIHPVLPVQELQHRARGVAHRPIVLDHDVLHGLHQPPLDVTRL